MFDQTELILYSQLQKKSIVTDLGSDNGISFWHQEYFLSLRG